MANQFLKRLLHRSIISLSGLSLSSAVCVSAALLLPAQPEFKTVAGLIGGLSGCLAVMGSKQIHEQKTISFQQLADQFGLASNVQTAALATCIFSAAITPNSNEYPYRQLDFWFKGSAFVLALCKSQSVKGFLQSDPLGDEEFNFGIEQSYNYVLEQQQASSALPPEQKKQIDIPAQVVAPEPEPLTTSTTPAQPAQTWTPDIELEDNQYTWVEDLLEYPSILVWGPQGSGKSTFVEWLIYERIKRGHKVEIYDPHRKAGTWKGLNVYGGGMNYEEIDSRLERVDELVKQRYQQYEIVEGYNPQPITVLAEEFTRWSKKCECSADFFETSLTDIRKINMQVIYVSHARTMTGLGGAKGLAATRDAGLLELELEAVVNPTTRKAFPAFKGRLKYPNQNAKEAQSVAIAQWMKIGESHFPTPSPQQESFIHQHFNPESKVTFQDRRLLPTHPGVYCVADSKDTPLYVGEAGDIRLRWNPANPQYKHHWLPVIEGLIAQGEQIFIYSKVCSNREELEGLIEAQLKPRWNGRNVQEVVQELNLNVNAERERLNVAFHEAFRQITPELRCRIISCKRMGLSIQETIESTFSYNGKPVTKGGSKGYQKSKEVYDKIIREAGS